MTLFELQAWLGHRTPNTTQHYAQITPNTLTRAYTEACYFARNIRTVEVLLDRDAVTSGAAAAGEPWQHYDLGHGYCTYTLFEQCPHRMACAKCDFYIPKDSGKAQLLEAKGNLQRMLVSIPLTDDERAAVEDGQTALDTLLTRLADVATPSGTTPRQMDAPPGTTSLRWWRAATSALARTPSTSSGGSPTSPARPPPSAPRPGTRAERNRACSRHGSNTAPHCAQCAGNRPSPGAKSGCPPGDSNGTAREVRRAAQGGLAGASALRRSDPAGGAWDRPGSGSRRAGRGACRERPSRRRRRPARRR